MKCSLLRSVNVVELFCVSVRYSLFLNVSQSIEVSGNIILYKVDGVRYTIPMET